jgi:hypothetical protein
MSRLASVISQAINAHFRLSRALVARKVCSQGIAVRSLALPDSFRDDGCPAGEGSASCSATTAADSTPRHVQPGVARPTCRARSQSRVRLRRVDCYATVDPWAVILSGKFSACIGRTGQSQDRLPDVSLKLC